jgi:beta-N-acetylhexosaminidase
MSLTACAATAPTDQPGITGTVTNVVSGDGRPSSLTVESTGTQPPGQISDKAAVTIPPTTQFFAADGSAAKLADISAIRLGTRVRVWFSGPIAESYPIQASASAVQILGK